ncbi:InlB B-repeat-containing protein [Enterocloster sp.]|uniref:InlB B-repeat-containing protein n=1 Tax=Enterocloster sp. TaxID=2719315 RepID=UPI001747EFAF
MKCVKRAGIFLLTAVITAETPVMPGYGAQSGTWEGTAPERLRPSRAYSASASVPSKATPSRPSGQKATSSVTATASTPSQTPEIVIAFEAVRPDPQELPSWYSKMKQSLFRTSRHYYFTDRYGQEQYRIYGYYEEESQARWYECDARGLVTNESQFVDLDWEDAYLAPFRWKSGEVGIGEIRRLWEQSCGPYEETGYPEVISGRKENYDGTDYEIWRIAQGEQEDRSYFYGVCENQGEKAGEERWYPCDAEGRVIEGELPEQYGIAAPYSEDVTAEEFEARYMSWTYWYFGVKEGKIPSGGSTLYVPCGLYKKYENKVGVGIRYLGSSGTDRLMYQAVYRFNNDYTLRDYNRDSGHSSWLNPTTEVDESCWYWTTNSRHVYTAQEFAQGYYQSYSESEGNQTIYFDYKPQYFRMKMQHTYGDWITSQAPSCVGTGMKKRSCTGCGASETQTLPASGHTWEAAHYTGAGNGTHYRRCTGQGCTASTDLRMNPYTIQFDGNGGSGSMEPQDHVYNTGKMLPSNEFSRPHYSFKEWNTQRDGSGTAYQEGQTVRNLTGAYEGKVILYAVWEPDSYQVTFDDGMNGQQNVVKNLKYTSILGPLPEFIRKGYTFKGFYTDPQQGERIEESRPVPSQDTTYYARWEANAYKLQLHTEKALCSQREKNVIFDQVTGELPIPVMEDYQFLGWFKKPYGGDGQERIMEGEKEPEADLRHCSGDVYTEDRDMDLYGYMKLRWQEHGSACSRRPGADGIFSSRDDNFYENGPDRQPGTRDDRRIHPGKDREFGSEDDFYLGEGGNMAYPAKDREFGTGDDYRDEKDGTNTRPGKDGILGTEDDMRVSNGLDRVPGNGDDWMDNSLAYPETNRRPGSDGVFGTVDDEIYWNGPDGVPGTKDDSLIHPGFDGEYGTKDDWTDNSPYYPETNRRPGADGEFGTADDEIYWNGPDQIPGTKDDSLIHPGLDGEYGTKDDWTDNSPYYPETNRRPGADGEFGTADDEIYWNGPDGMPGTEDDSLIYPGFDREYGTKDDWTDNSPYYPETNRRPGADGEFGTADDEIYWNGPDQIPGTGDDSLIFPGPDGEYGTEDDCIDNSDEKENTNRRPGSDGMFGTGDDEVWDNGPDKIPGTSDDKLWRPNGSGGGSGSSSGSGKPGRFETFAPGGPGNQLVKENRVQKPVSMGFVQPSSSANRSAPCPLPVQGKQSSAADVHFDKVKTFLKGHDAGRADRKNARESIQPFERLAEISPSAQLRSPSVWLLGAAAVILLLWGLLTYIIFKKTKENTNHEK